MTVLQLLSHISSLRRTRETLQQGRQGYHLIQLLQMFRGLKASDDRDQLFAFWGLACDHLPTPDYGCSTEAMYIRIARWLLEDTKDLLVLSMGLRTDQSDLRLPSWVPNWASGFPFEENAWRRRLHCLDAYDSAKGIESSVQFPDAATLCLRGIMVDTVTDVATKTLTSEDVTEHAALIKSWMAFAYSPKDDEPFQTSFCETMIEGCSPRSPQGFIQPATESDISLCREMLIRTIADDIFDDDAEQFLRIRQCHIAGCWGRALFRTGHGSLLGLGSVDVKQGDQVWLVGGCKAPLILRRRPGECPLYSLIGHAFVQGGLMNGAAVDPMSPLQQCRLV
jgi:hypothetical protein